MSNRYTYSDPTLSLWQSAVAEVQRQHSSAQSQMALATGETTSPPTVVSETALTENDLMAPVHTLAASLAAGQPPRQTPAPAEKSKPVALSAQTDLAGRIVDCAKTAGAFLWAEMTGDQQQSQILAGELQASECDIDWGECVTLYLSYQRSGGRLPYRPNLNPVFDLGTRTRLAILGDWGTGDDVATNLLQQVASFNPEVLIHLGDVYYSGTQNEEHNNFLDICRQVLGNNVLLFSLCGNHDMYSGGNGYYWLVDQLGQQASYFCLQNSHWQFLAMDTGHNDNNPVSISTDMTSLMTVETAGRRWAEENWLLDKINSAGARNTVLLSHHQLFSPFVSVGSVNGQAYAYNENLRATFQAVMSRIAWWFWGHEHTLAIYDPYLNLQRGRCVGASAVPVFKDEQSYSNASGLETYGGAALPTWNAQAVLGNNGASYNNCFAILTLNGASANVDYYQVPLLGKATRLPVTDSM